MRTAITISQEVTGLELTHRKSRRHSAVTLIDKNFADDIAFLCNTTQEAKPLFHTLEEEVKLLHLHTSYFKTEYTIFNRRMRGLIEITP